MWFFFLTVVSAQSSKSIAEDTNLKNVIESLILPSIPEYAGSVHKKNTHVKEFKILSYHINDISIKATKNEKFTLSKDIRSKFIQNQISIASLKRVNIIKNKKPSLKYDQNWSDIQRTWLTKALDKSYPLGLLTGFYQVELGPFSHMKSEKDPEQKGIHRSFKIDKQWDPCMVVEKQMFRPIGDKKS